jgi:hypothetical protein
MMDVENSCFAVSWVFHSWVRLMEDHTRKMEIIDSVQLGPRRLISSPPTGAGIPLLAHANSSGQTHLLCLSDRPQRVAATYIRRHGITRLATIVESFFQIPALVLSSGCYRVTIRGPLARNGFKIQKEKCVRRLG